MRPQLHGLNRNGVVNVLRNNDDWMGIQDILHALPLNPCDTTADYAEWLLDVCIRAGLVETLTVADARYYKATPESSKPSSVKPDMLLRTAQQLTRSAPETVARNLGKRRIKVSAFERSPLGQHSLPSVMDYIIAIGAKAELVTADGVPVSTELSCQLRQAAGLSQSMVAHALGIDPTGYSRIENDILKKRISRIMQIFYEIFDVSVEFRIRVEGQDPLILRRS